MTINEIYSIILAASAAAAAGLVGAFALMKRTILAGDVMSHIALPGLGLALLWGINPLLGGTATLFLGIFIIWRLENKTRLTTEVVIGVIFASAVAVGALVTPEEELIHALFGGFGKMSVAEFVIGFLLSAAVIFLLWRLKDRLVIGLFSAELASATNISTNLLGLYFLLIFGLAIIVGLRFLGAILVGSLVIIPAAAARQLTHTLGSFLITSSVIGVVSMVAGFLLSKSYGLSLGPTVVLISAAIFALSLLKKKE